MENFMTDLLGGPSRATLPASAVH